MCTALFSQLCHKNLYPPVFISLSYSLSPSFAKPTEQEDSRGTLSPGRCYPSAEGKMGLGNARAGAPCAAWPPHRLGVRCRVEVLPEVLPPPSLRPWSMTPRFPPGGGQGSWHSVREQPACSQVSQFKCSQRISHPLP